MSYKILTIPRFDKDLKQLAEKYTSIKQDVARLGVTLQNNPFTGSEIGNNCYKIRMAISSKNKGKSGGTRVIAYVYVEKENVILLSIYDKSEKGSISDMELKKLIKDITC